MKSEWKIMRADEFCSAVTDGTHDSPKPQLSGKKLITSKHLKGTRIDFASANWIREEDYKKIVVRSKVEQWDILYSMIGTIGNIYMEKNADTEYACKNVGIFKLAGRKNDAYWLYYYLQSKNVQEYINTQLRGSTQSYIPLGALRGMPIIVPPKEMQKKIIDILRSFDEKIELNNNVNDNLQQQMQAIYQERFGGVDETQEGKTLSDICTYSKERVSVSQLDGNTYFSTENMQPEKAGAVEASSLPSTIQTTACHIGDTLVSNIRPYFKKIVYCYEDCGCSADVLCFVPVQPKYSAFLYSTLYADKFFDFMVAGSKGTKMPRGDKQQIMTYPVVFPSDEQLSKFNSLAMPILEQIHSNRSENERLSKIRDALLPKLISGEIDTSNMGV